MKVHKQSGSYALVEYGTGIRKYVLEYTDDSIIDEIASSYNKEEIERKFDEHTKQKNKNITKGDL